MRIDEANAPISSAHAPTPDLEPLDSTGALRPKPMTPPVALACPICDSADTELNRRDVRDFEYFFEPERAFALFRCRSCQSEFLDPRPTEREIPGFYPADYHAYHEDHGVLARTLVGVRARLRGSYYRRLLGDRPGQLFDVGAGDCRHFDELKRFCDLEFSGVEIQPEIARRARERGYNIVEGMLETMDLAGHEGRYDVVSMNHIIEHVIHPQKMAARAFALLKPGAVAIGQLPANDSWDAAVFARAWGGYHYPRHLQAFSRRGLRHVLESVGFVDVRVKSTPHIQMAVSVQNTLIANGWRPRMKFGKTPIYSLLLLLVLPFELVALAANRTGIVDFEAHKPAASPLVAR